MPTPRKGESEKDFVKRCIPIVIEDGTAKDGSQANAVCHSIYKKSKEKNATSMSLFDATIMTASEKENTVVQTLIFDKKVFKDRESAKKWAKDHGFSTNTIRETNKSYRIRQRPDADFKPESYKTLTFTKGVNAVVGYLK